MAGVAMPEHGHPRWGRRDDIGAWRRSRARPATTRGPRSPGPTARGERRRGWRGDPAGCKATLEGAGAAFGQRILTLAPHPEGEVVGFAGAIGRARTAGAALSVLFLTHGCLDAATMWPWARGRYAEMVARR